mmetsp:Transcript_124892/g.216492  ORF Transcript_124892/g.216492 Transcript_124892/m.216492 type:complete len:243 (+) Transcript_124892:3772-4500(+)
MPTSLASSWGTCMRRSTPSPPKGARASSKAAPMSSSASGSRSWPSARPATRGWLLPSSRPPLPHTASPPKDCWSCPCAACPQSRGSMRTSLWCLPSRRRGSLRPAFPCGLRWWAPSSSSPRPQSGSRQTAARAGCSSPLSCWPTPQRPHRRSCTWSTSAPSPWTWRGPGKGRGRGTSMCSPVRPPSPAGPPQPSRAASARPPGRGRAVPRACSAVRRRWGNPSPWQWRPPPSFPASILTPKR